MELNYTTLRKKKVVNVLDGKDLGRVNDLVFGFPDGKIKSIVVSKKAFFPSEELIIDLCCVTKIGDDTVLVSIGKPPQETCEEESDEE